MANYIILGKFTEQGIRTVKDTVTRADNVRKLARDFGVTVKDIYWTIGEYDVCTFAESSDDNAATAFALAIGQQGNVRTQMMRALTADEMRGVLKKVTQAREAVPA